jgi:hypothetical protein
MINSMIGEKENVERYHVACWVGNYIRKEDKPIFNFINQNDIRENENDFQCQICFENKAIVTIIPCGHKKICKTCSLKISTERWPKCPFCKRKVEIFQETF